MSKRSPLLLLEDILDSIEKIFRYTDEITFDDFCSDAKTIDAVIRNFEIIGEAANRLPEEMKEQASTTDWYRIRGFRNRIVHDYMGIDYQTVWLIKENYLPHLRKEITALIEDRERKA